MNAEEARKRTAAALEQRQRYLSQEPERLRAQFLELEDAVAEKVITLRGNIDDEIGKASAGRNLSARYQYKERISAEHPSTEEVELIEALGGTIVQRVCLGLEEDGFSVQSFSLDGRVDLDALPECFIRSFEVSWAQTD